MMKYRKILVGRNFNFPPPSPEDKALQTALNEIGEENVRHITSTTLAGGKAFFTIFYHEDDPA